MFVGTVTEFGINYRRKDENKKKSKGTDANHSENPSDVENNNGKKNSIEITGKSNVYKVTEKEILEYQKNGKAKLDDSKREPERKEPTKRRFFSQNSHEIMKMSLCDISKRYSYFYLQTELLKFYWLFLLCQTALKF